MKAGEWGGRKVLVFGREAGAGDALGPAVALLNRLGASCLVVAGEAAAPGFARSGVSSSTWLNFDAGECERLCRSRWRSLPDLVFTSATSLPWLDMTERHLWRWARDRDIPSAALVDQWQNYALRFSGNSPGERLAYQPDVILLMDRIAQEDAIGEGLPAERLRIAGQPAFDAIASSGTVDPAVAALKREHHIAGDTTVIVFVAESLKKDFGERLGYDEYSTMQFALDLVSDAVRTGQVPPPHLIVKLHPQNGRSDFEPLLADRPFPITVIAREHEARTVLALADIVLGMTSILLVHALLMGKVTVSLEVGAGGASQLIATRVGAIPFLREPADARAAVLSLLTDSDARSRWRARQSGWDLAHGSSARRVADHLDALLLERTRV